MEGRLILLWTRLVEVKPVKRGDWAVARSMPEDVRVTKVGFDHGSHFPLWFDGLAKGLTSDTGGSARVALGAAVWISPVPERPARVDAAGPKPLHIA